MKFHTDTRRHMHNAMKCFLSFITNFVMNKQELVFQLRQSYHYSFGRPCVWPFEEYFACKGLWRRWSCEVCCKV